MITLTNGFPQGPDGLIVPNGSIALQLNVDATVIAAPGGFVSAEEVVVFQFNAAGQIQPNSPATAAKIYSNKELQPQNAFGLGTYYLVTFYDANGARINKNPMWWQFPEAAGATVDISQLTPLSTVGGNVIFYPTSFGGGTVTSVAFVGDGTVLSATPSTPVTASGNISATLLTQGANLVFVGPTSGGAALPIFRSLVNADVATVYTNLTPATNVANQSSPILAIAGTYWNGSASVTDTYTLQDVIAAGTNPNRGLVLANLAGGGSLTFGGTINAGLLASASVVTAGTDITLVGAALATSGANVNSGRILITGSVWNGAAPVADTWTIQNVIGAGTLPGQTLTITCNQANGAVSIGTTLLCGQLNSGAIFAGGNAQLTSAAATGGGNISSPNFQLESAWWDGAASHFSITSIQDVEGAGANPTATTQISNSGAFAWAGVSIAGNLSLTGTGIIAKYNNIATAGNGVPSEPFQIVATGLTANYNAGAGKTIFTPAAATTLRVTVTEYITTQATTSSTLPSLTLSWTDEGGVARTLALIATDSTNTTAVYHTATALIHTNGVTAVQVTSAGYASNNAAQMTYSLITTVEIL